MESNTSLKPQEVADMLKITRNMVYRMIRRGELQGYRVGNKVRVDLEDVEAYKKLNKKTKMSEMRSDVSPAAGEDEKMPLLHQEDCLIEKSDFVICGQDVILDVLTDFLMRHPHGVVPQRSYAGSYTGLCALYRDDVQVAAVHLWNGETGEYNLPYVKMLMPGVHAAVIRLASRRQGFCVIQGNPKSISKWEDLKRGGLTIANRQKGSATRILLDEHLKQLNIPENSLPGYRRELPTNLIAASIVARGGADVALCDEKTASQVQNVEFIPLQTEQFDLVMRQENLERQPFNAMLEIIRSSEFKEIISGIGGYDLTETGKMIEL